MSIETHLIQSAMEDTERRKHERFSRLRATFDFLKDSVYEGVPGVVRVDGGKPGPTLGISACTHGNEPAGLASAEYVLTHVVPNRDRLSGSVVLTVNNIEAAQKYFDAETTEARRKARFTEVNMNRLPHDVLEDVSDARYEVMRTRQLLPVFKSFTVGKDIHSVSQEDTDPMIIALGNTLPIELIRGMPIRKIVSNIDNVMSGKSVSDFYGSGEAPIPRFGIEAGSHEKLETFETAVTCTKALLGNLQMFDVGVRQNVPEYEEYFVSSSVLFPDESYKLSRVFKDFEFIKQGTVLARGNGPDIVADEDGHTLFATPERKPRSLAEEAMFLTRPVKNYV